MFPFGDAMRETAQLVAWSVNTIATSDFVVYVTRKLAAPILTLLLSILKSAEADNQASPESMQDSKPHYSQSGIISGPFY